MHEKFTREDERAFACTQLGVEVISAKSNINCARTHLYYSQNVKKNQLLAVNMLPYKMMDCAKDRGFFRVCVFVLVTNSKSRILRAK